ncbi:MAG TPA: hypothetical protein VFT50_06000 [Baekduia sp.]|nr:hypothetical protein [Baekduia sp.]
MRIEHHRRVPLVVLATVVLAAGVGAWLTSAGSSPARVKESGPTARKADRPGIAVLASQGSVARGADLAAFVRQNGDLGRFRSFVARATGADVAKVVLARTPALRSVVVSQGGGLVCVRNRMGVEGRGGSMACAPEDHATDPATPIIATDQTADNGTYVVTALLPDDVSRLRVYGRDGSAVTLVPDNNIATGSVGEPVKLAWDTAGGATYTRVVSPDPVTGR